MKKSTCPSPAGAAVLVVITYPRDSEGHAAAAPKLSIDGYATKEQLAAQQARGIMERRSRSPRPSTRSSSSATRPRQGLADAQIHLVRDGEGKDATWRMTAPVEASAGTRSRR
ncbi:MAG: hypothetical protein U1F43_12510 [Myxococcota bacterium]